MAFSSSDRIAEKCYLSGPDNQVKIEALKAMALAWGGSLVQLEEEEFERRAEAENWALAPFTNSDLGVDFDSKIVYYAGSDVPWPHIVHDMGHVFACLAPPEGSEEYDFFGWEWTIAQNLKGTDSYMLFNREYSVGDGDDLGGITPLELIAIVTERVGKAYSLGLVKDGVPQAIR